MPTRRVSHRESIRRLLAVLGVAAFVAVGCSGETPSEEAGEDTAPGTAEAANTTETESPPASGVPDPAETGGSGAGAIWDDPRGSEFADFQAEFDRAHPFGGLDGFCVPQEPAGDRQETDPGIGADTISVHHLRGELENLVDIGFGVDVGDTSLMFETFVGVINEDCGGIRGAPSSCRRAASIPSVRTSRAPASPHAWKRPRTSTRWW